MTVIGLSSAALAACGANSSQAPVPAPAGPARPRPHVVEYASDLTAKGSSDGSIGAGETTWFYELAQRDGEWRLVGGGSGP